MLKSNAPFACIAYAEDALLTHLRSQPVTLADVEALLHDARPVMLSDVEKIRRRHRYGPGARVFDATNVSCNRKIMDALATNIAFFHARDSISATDVEAILTHIVSADPGLFDLVIQKIEQGKHPYQHEIVPCPHVRPSFQYRESIDLLPRQTGKRKRFKKKTDTNTKIICTADPVERGLWATTRLHNGPGLHDWKRAEVKLPEETSHMRQKCHITRQVIAPKSLAIPIVGLTVQTMSPLVFSEDIGVKVRLLQWWHPSADRSILVAR